MQSFVWYLGFIYIHLMFLLLLYMIFTCLQEPNFLHNGQKERTNMKSYCEFRRAQVPATLDTESNELEKMLVMMNDYNYSRDKTT